MRIGESKTTEEMIRQIAEVRRGPLSVGMIEICDMFQALLTVRAPRPSMMTVGPDGHAALTPIEKADPAPAEPIAATTPAPRERKKQRAQYMRDYRRGLRRRPKKDDT